MSRMAACRRGTGKTLRHRLLPTSPATLYAWQCWQSPLQPEQTNFKQGGPRACYAAAHR